MTRALDRRDFAIRDLGCTACFMSNASSPCEKHHLNEGDQPGRKRRGEKFTVGLCQWHHIGKCACMNAITDCAACKRVFGPSWRHHKREFIDTFGDGDALLAEQNRRIDEYNRSTVS